VGRPDPAQIVDRDGDTAAFATMLALDSPRRVMVVSDTPGRGKTDLLRKLRHQCEWGEPQVPTAMFDFEARSVTSEMEIMDDVADQLKQVGVVLPSYERLAEARLFQRIGQFAEVWKSVSGSIDLSGAQLSGAAQAAGVIVNIRVEEGGTLEGLPGAAWSDALDTHAWRLCREAFFSDLLEVARERPVALFFDTVNSADEEMRRWLVNELVRRRLLTSREEHHLLLVLAGTDADVLMAPVNALGPECLLPAEPLQAWESEQVQAFLAVHGFPNMADADIETIRIMIGAGTSLVKAIKIAAILREST